MKTKKAFGKIYFEDADDKKIMIQDLSILLKL